MAKVNYGGVVQDARGKQNGIVYSRNRSGPYIRRKTTPTNPNTTAQGVARSTLSDLSKQWGNVLTQSQRDAWNAFATAWPTTDVFGNSINITGQNYFISLNARLQNAGLPIFLDPPASLAVVPIPMDTVLTADHSTGSADFDQTAVGTPTTLLFYVWGAAPMSAGRIPKKADYRYLGTIPHGTGSYPQNISAGDIYNAKFGAYAAGSRIALLVATLDPATGAISVGVPLNAIAT